MGMSEDDSRRFDDPSERGQGTSREPFWLAPGNHIGDAFDRLADLTDQAAAAAKRAADAIRAELESITAVTEDAEDQGSEEARLLRSAHTRLTELDREATGLARLLGQAREPESPGTADSQGSESVSPGARVLARQMAADGHAPEEIEARLAEEFSVRDAHAVVEQMLRSK
jgi:hypothetical protein